MAPKARGRGLVATLGFIALIGGLVGGGFLYVLAMQRPGDAVDAFARAPIGCTTTLQFTDLGEFYIYEESAPILQDLPGGCEPTADPAAAFSFRLSGPDGPVAVRPDDSVTYAEGAREGSSVATIEIVTAGQYELAVVGVDPATVAAVGRDPQDGVERLRRLAYAVVAAGAVIGLTLLVVAGRRSKRAAVVGTPIGPGYGTLHNREMQGAEAWPPEPPRLDQVPVNPHLPPERAIARPLSTDDEGATSPWAPPRPTDRLE
jgi:hypothetical protein